MNTVTERTDEQTVKNFLVLLGTRPQVVSEPLLSQVAQAIDRLCPENRAAEQEAEAGSDADSSDLECLPGLDAPTIQPGVARTLAETLLVFSLGVIAYLLMPPFLVNLLFP